MSASSVISHNVTRELVRQGRKCNYVVCWMLFLNKLSCYNANARGPTVLTHENVR